MNKEIDFGGLGFLITMIFLFYFEIWLSLVLHPLLLPQRVMKPNTAAKEKFQESYIINIFLNIGGLLLN